MSELPALTTSDEEQPEEPEEKAEEQEHAPGRFDVPSGYNVMTGDFPLSATAPRVVLSNGRSVADPFFNITYPLARRNDVNIIRGDDAHQVNLRVQKTIELPGSRRIEVSGDVFNLFNNAAATDFLSKDVRSSLFNQPTNYVAAQVGQIGLRVTF